MESTLKEVAVEEVEEEVEAMEANQGQHKDPMYHKRDLLKIQVLINY